MIDYGKFRLSLKRLEEQHENYRQDNPVLSELDREAIAESVIQRFETCCDSLWKVLKRYLAEELGVADVYNSPKPVIRQAHENFLLVTPLEQWFGYLEARNSTAHDYDGEKALACLEHVPDFIDDAVGLYQTMSGQPWE
ncbi:MAG: HI0074 family nucleotidyltransferase substrate-binding subunit [Caldilineaceae bacterium]|nr:HI0074 family nucleotidyltransferase substrate-binding subunit [Caldilineaceae bacterium]